MFVVTPDGVIFESVKLFGYALAGTLRTGHGVFFNA
jgi:hypothetical protein